MRKFATTLAAAAILTVGVLDAAPKAAFAAGAGPVPPQGDFTFTGFFGTFDRGELQRGLQVYKEACSSCHGMDLIRYRDLAGIGYSEEQIKAFAAEFEVVKGPNEDGEMFDAPAEPFDSFVNPYANIQEAASLNGGKAPPDLSLIVKARATGLGNIGANFVDMLQGGEFASGTSYVQALLSTGYIEEPTLEDKKVCLPQGASESVEAWETRLNEWDAGDNSFNKWFPGCAIAMPYILFDDTVEYADGTAATSEQMAHDVAVFLTWASEPTLEQRKQTGIMVLAFLFFFTGLLYAVKRQVWADVKKH